jgi:hypothetical protein
VFPLGSVFNVELKNGFVIFLRKIGVDDTRVEFVEITFPNLLAGSPVKLSGDQPIRNTLIY